jgi:hypothetical protein
VNDESGVGAFVRGAADPVQGGLDLLRRAVDALARDLQALDEPVGADDQLEFEALAITGHRVGLRRLRERVALAAVPRGLGLLLLDDPVELRLRYVSRADEQRRLRDVVRCRLHAEVHSNECADRRLLVPVLDDLLGFLDRERVDRLVRPGERLTDPPVEPRERAGLVYGRRASPAGATFWPLAATHAAITLARVAGDVVEDELGVDAGVVPDVDEDQLDQRVDRLLPRSSPRRLRGARG